MDLAVLPVARADPLAPHVLRLMGFRGRVPPAAAQEAPVPGTALILALEHGWGIRAAPGEREQHLQSFAGGLSLGPAVSRHEGRLHGLQVDLTPLGTSAVLGVPGAALAGLVVAFEDLVGEVEARLLVERLALTAGWPARFALVRRWLARRVAASDPVRPDVVHALGRIERSGGRVPIDEVRRDLGCSTRHLATRFREAVGVPPKAFARVVRFDRATRLLRDTELHLAAVAASTGYTDQAHLARDVRALAHATPSMLRAGATRPQASSSAASGDDTVRHRAGPAPAASGAGAPRPVTSVQDGGARTT